MWGRWNLLGVNREYVIAEPDAATDPAEVEKALSEWSLDIEWTARVDGNVVVCGTGRLGREGVQTFLAENDIASIVRRVLHVEYVDASVAGFGHLYVADDGTLEHAESLTGREYSPIEVFDYFKREHDVDGAY